MRVLYLFVAAISFMHYTLSAHADPPEAGRAIDDKADNILQAMSNLLAEQKSFHLEAFETLDVVDSEGRKIQLSTKRSLSIERPNKIYAESIGDEIDRKAWYNHSKLTVLDRSEEAYIETDVPNTIDEMLDFIAQQFHLVLPLLDLALSNLHESLLPNIIAGEYVGLSHVDNFTCHHLAFVQEDVAWQIWIQSGSQPLLRKLVIDYKDLEAQPQFTARIVKWELNPDFAPNFFEAVIPDGTERVPMMKLDFTDGKNPRE